MTDDGPKSHDRFVDPFLGAPGPDLAIIARASELVPMLRANAAASEEQRRVTDESIQALAEAGLLAITLPKRFGGQGANFRTLIELTAEIARGDGSAGWVAGLLNVCTWFGTLFSERAQQEVFGANPTARLCGSIFAPKGGIEQVEGGLRVSGAWPYCSGSLWADWATLALTTGEREDGSPIQELALVPMSDLENRDTWHVTGMRATASTTLVADKIFIPHHRIQTLEAMSGERYAREYAEEPNYRASFVPVAILVLAAAQIGLARAALDITLTLRANKAVTYTMFSQAKNSPMAQIAVAVAASAIDAAHLLAARACADIDSAALRAEPLDVVTRARIRMDTGQCAELCRTAIGKLMTANGAGSFALHTDLQRIWRDSEISARHAQVEPEVAKLTYGQALFGLDKFALLFF
jgi:alkylation response protein AidB-like acyl-CoA dehydrogenase